MIRGGAHTMQIEIVKPISEFADLPGETIPINII